MAEQGRGKAAPGFLLPPHQGEDNSRELKLAPSRLPSLLTASAGVSALQLFRRQLPARRGPPPQASTAPPDHNCLSPGTPSQGAAPRSSGRLPHLGPAQEDSVEETGGQWLCLPGSAALHPLGRQQPKDFVSSRGDFPLAQWGFLPSGIVWMSAQLEPEGGVQPVLRSPPNICILTLAMMIAGIPTVPVPGVREEDMILAAQSFMAGRSLQPGGAEGEGAVRRRRGSAAPCLGLACKRDKQQRKRAAGRSLLLPLFLAQLEQ